VSHENDDDDLRAEARRERAEQSRAWHWCSDCHGHTGPGSPCYDGPEPEEETMTLAEMFAQCEDDYLDFDKWTDAPSKRADLAAFILLDKLQPGGGDIVSASEHDEFHLSIDCDELAKVGAVFATAPTTTACRCSHDPRRPPHHHAPAACRSAWRTRSRRIAPAPKPSASSTFCCPSVEHPEPATTWPQHWPCCACALRMRGARTTLSGCTACIASEWAAGNPSAALCAACPSDQHRERKHEAHHHWIHRR
jgi:hypothetical protein